MPLKYQVGPMPRAGDIIMKKIHGPYSYGFVEDTDITEVLTLMKSSQIISDPKEKYKSYNSTDTRIRWTKAERLHKYGWNSVQNETGIV